MHIPTCSLTKCPYVPTNKNPPMDQWNLMPALHFPTQIIVSSLHKYKVHGFIQIHTHIYSLQNSLQSVTEFLLFSLGSTQIHFSQKWTWLKSWLQRCYRKTLTGIYYVKLFYLTQCRNSPLYTGEIITHIFTLFFPAVLLQCYLHYDRKHCSFQIFSFTVYDTIFLFM